MHPRTDPVGKVSEMYKEGETQVPYLTFMHIFNDLLDDPLDVIPRKPSEELKEKFRAACMAVGMGIVDPEGRAEQRVREFKNNVVPVWMETLDEREGRDTEALLRGVSRRPKKRTKADDTHFDLNRPVSEKSSALLARLRLIDGKPIKGSDTVTATGAIPPGERLAPPPTPDGVYESMSALCRAIKEGLIAVAPGGDDQGRVLGKYAIEAHTVVVKLARASGQIYAVLTVDVGTESMPGGLGVMDELASGMGFLKMTGNAYMRKQENRVHTLKVMAKKISLACAVAESDLGEAIVSMLSRLHWDMGELVERIDQVA